MFAGGGRPQTLSSAAAVPPNPEVAAVDVAAAAANTDTVRHAVGPVGEGATGALAGADTDLQLGCYSRRAAFELGVVLDRVGEGRGSDGEKEDSE